MSKDKDVEYDSAVIEAELESLNYKLGSVRETLRLVRLAKKQKADAIRRLRDQIALMGEDVVGASKGTNVGSKECKAALDSAVKKLEKAEQILKNL